LSIERYLDRKIIYPGNWNLDYDFYMSKIQMTIAVYAIYWLRSNIHCPSLKIYSVRNMHYRFSVLAVNIGTQPI